MIFSFLQAISQMSIRIASAPRSLTRCPGPDFLLLPSSRCPLLFRPVSCSLDGTSTKSLAQPIVESDNPKLQQVVSHPLSITTENKDVPTEGSRKHARTTSARSPHDPSSLSVWRETSSCQCILRCTVGDWYLPWPQDTFMASGTTAMKC
ncbi:hypothetical protein C8F01DRAFT_303011 [Mycena amicta]|nr:hypothetical protein C8F01DRAFT_303011 [Mycena amicta]